MNRNRTPHEAGADVLASSMTGGEMTTAHIKALDLFAGTGWGVACQRLGIKEAGVEIMPEAVETREANGMETIYRDVWDGLSLTAEQHRDTYGSYGLLIASPPCQTFSMAGNGSGRAALDEVLEAIQLHAYKDAAALRAFGEKHDMRTALVLSPLAYVWRDRPRLVAMEQVPTVLPVWEACAEVMREWGYEVKVEILNAEQFGVPQTRKRAILVARRGGPVALPKPTHSRYYPRTPDKLDAGVASWVSMGSALGFAGFTAEKVMGRGMVERYGTRPGREAETPAFAIRASAGGMEPGGFVLRSNAQPAFTAISSQSVAGKGRAERHSTSPVLTVTTNSDRVMLRSNYGTGGDASKRGERKVGEPAATLTSKADRMKWDGVRRLTANEASTLQSYPDGFTWTGKQFLQIGNAVPPLLAEHILAALVGIPTSQEES